MNSVKNKFYVKKFFYSQVNQLKKFLFSSTSKNWSLNQNVSDKNDFNIYKSELSKYLYLRIKLSGPISVATYMKQVLTHPTTGYYINQDVFGREGDFITSPEISQLFGEMIAIWIISESKKICNNKFQLVELGPGRGSLSQDILRVFRQLGMSDKVSLHLVEISPHLSDIQESNLCSLESNKEDDQNPTGKYYKKRRTVDNIEVFWYKSILDIPEGFSIFIAQEFFDALPIYKFQKTSDGWFEVLVDVDPNSKTEEKFRFVLSKTPACDMILSKDEKRDHVEISLESINIMRYISSAITQNGGFALIIDYGHNGDKTDTFRAFRKHKQCHPLSEPGTADLTADVDFSSLKKVVQKQNNVLCFGPVNQRDFLVELGINIRMMNLCRKVSKEQRQRLEFGYKKIMDAEKMGTCFKVVSMFPYCLKDYFKKFPVHGFQTCTIDK